MPKTKTTRNNNLAKIHLAKKQLGLDDDTYRAILSRVCGVSSAADLDDAGHRKLLREFQRLGWKPQPATHAKVSSIREPQLKRMRWLWLRLIDAGAVRSLEKTALAHYAKRLTGVDRLEWLTVAQAHKVLGSLEQWVARVGAAV